MFSVEQKRAIADAVQKILQETHHQELPPGEIKFHLHVEGAESWSYADIKNNGAVGDIPPSMWNQFNEISTKQSKLRPWKDLKFGDIYPLSDFTEMCENGIVTDEDGNGYYGNEDGYYQRYRAYPSEIRDGRIDRRWTCVVWYNK